MLRFADTITTPPGGFQYEDKATGFKVKTRSWRDCKAAVWKYRVANGGDVSPNWEIRLESEIILQMNLQGTSWAIDDEQYHPSTGEGIGVGDILRALSSFGKIIASGVALVDQEEANRRANICSTGGPNGTPCPQNQHVQSCMGCSGIRSLINAVRGDQSTPDDDKMNGCNVCKCPTKIKVWLPLTSIDNTGLTYPDFCWQNQG